MKPLRWLYYLILTISFFAGLYTGLKVYYIVFFTLLLAVLLAVSLNLWTAYSFKYQQTLSANVCEKGRGVTLYLKIINERPVPLSLIEAHVKVVSFRENFNLVFSLAPIAGQAFEVPLTAPYRGCFEVGMTTLKITDIFGLTVLKFDMRRLPYYRLPKLTVLPRAEAPGAVSCDIADTKLFGDAYLNPADTGDSVSGARLFNQGDALKRIHWKKSAQQGALYVKQYDYPEREHITILIDTSPYNLKNEDLLIYSDTVTECASSIALHSLLNNRTVNILSSHNPTGPAVCEAVSSFGSLRRYLALLPFEQEQSFNSVLARIGAANPQMRALFIITRGATPSPELAAFISIMTKFSTTLVFVGGNKPSGYANALWVESGAVAAERLSGVL